MIEQRAQCVGCAEWDDEIVLGMMLDGSLWHEDCWRERMVRGRRLMSDKRPMLEGARERPQTSVEAVERATYSGMRAIVRDWLLYPETIPAINSDAAKALNGWPARAGTDRLARVAMALIALKASSDRTDVYSVIAHLDRHDELIGAGGRRYIVSLLSLDDLAAMQPTR